ncbi:hypothetical protein AURDEDRAFT_162184 [Auricularia subglabra TFB-10046 SS5]|nr:hypothetical protein AURDEDRAFT_162184 [Auricularia subglabra TFB-10046 SS5]
MAELRKHPQFSIADGDEHLWLRAGDVLFCVHKSILNSKSPLFKDILTLPPEHLELLLGFVYWTFEREKRAYTTDQLLDMLELASMLLIPDCRSKALELLATREIPAAKKLQVALDCQVPQWIRPALRWLVDNYEQITLTDTVIMGHTLFYHVSMTRHTLSQCWQAVVAFVGEYRANSSCTTPEACRAAFRQLADSGFACLYTNPVSPLQAQNAADWFENQPKGDLCSRCWSTKSYSLNYEEVTSDGDGVTVFNLEDEIFSKAVQDLHDRMAPFEIDAA